mmetsp:Transcript_98023/g.280444  ORF Transcript_98023/g.280444 Transcript_98023/m.280444 type:complete len:251 (+) Transcript_98023:172-924(+)
MCPSKTLSFSLITVHSLAPTPLVAPKTIPSTAATPASSSCSSGNPPGGGAATNGDIEGELIGGGSFAPALRPAANAAATPPPPKGFVGVLGPRLDGRGRSRPAPKLDERRALRAKVAGFPGAAALVPKLAPTSFTPSLDRFSKKAMFTLAIADLVLAASVSNCAFSCSIASRSSWACSSISFIRACNADCCSCSALSRCSRSSRSLSADFWSSSFSALKRSFSSSKPLKWCSRECSVTPLLLLCSSISLA